ncbi:MAG: chorismate synthase [Candidatus Bathyarchaeia archaeon]
MSANSFGKAFVATIFGESHGRCIGTVIDGCPAGLLLRERDIQVELDKRRPGTSKFVSPRREEDKVEILSGVFKSRTTGGPICVLIWNKDIESKPYEDIKTKPRPGRADYTAWVRYGGYEDYRGGGRFSGRITAAFVMAGAIAKKLLATKKIEVLVHTTEIGGVKIPRSPSVAEIKREVYRNPVRCAVPEVLKDMEEVILRAKKEGDSVGGIVEGVVLNVPAGVGHPTMDSLDADLAKILFIIPAVKGVEVGAGFEVTRLRGSENNDPFAVRKGRVVTLTNRSGGILGGISTGMPIVVRVGFKPTPSIKKKQKTVDLEKMTETEIEIGGRHDPCVVPRAVPVVESAIAMTLADHMIRNQIIPLVLR